MVDIAGAQEIGVAGMHVASRIDGLLRRRQRLPKHLAAENVFCANVAALPTEQVQFQPFQLQQVQQFVDQFVAYFGHGHRRPAFRGRQL